MEVARSVGMTKLEAISYVIVPQSLRRSIPGFQNEFTIVLKDTSIAIILGVTELLGTAEDLFLQQNRTGTALELILAISLVYFVLTVTTNRGLEFAGDYFGVPTGENAGATPCSASRTCTRATATRRCSAASTSSWRRVTWRCSPGRVAPASPRCCAVSTGSPSRTRGQSTSTASASAAPTPT